MNKLSSISSCSKKKIEYELMVKQLDKEFDELIGLNSINDSDMAEAKKKLAIRHNYLRLINFADEHLQNLRKDLQT